MKGLMNKNALIYDSDARYPRCTWCRIYADANLIDVCRWVARRDVWSRKVVPSRAAARHCGASRKRRKLRIRGLGSCVGPIPSLVFHSFTPYQAKEKTTDKTSPPYKVEHRNWS